ncbi:MAG: hypothetical protein GXY05_02640 [Clostridiales bacterium]|nr:hypothetical protein [Clostridiales bacterium]
MKKYTPANAVAGIFGILVGVLTFIFTKDFLLTLSAFLFSLFLAMATRPFYQGLFEKKNKPLPTTISTLRERGFESGVPEQRVFYALLITQDVTLDVNDPEQKAILEQIFEVSAAAMREKYDFFRSRYAVLQERELPTKISVGSCTEKSTSIGKCYRDWQKHVSVDNRAFPAKENIDVFFHDLQFTDQEGVTHNAVTAVQFYRW